MGTSERPSPTTPANTCSPLSLDSDSIVLVTLLPPLRYSTHMAIARSLPHLHIDLQRRSYLRHPLETVEIPPKIEDMVCICIILSSTPPSDSTTRTNKKIHIWVPSTRNYLTWRLCRILNRGAGILGPVSRYHKHSSDVGLQFPHTFVP